MDDQVVAAIARRASWVRAFWPQVETTWRNLANRQFRWATREAMDPQLTVNGNAWTLTLDAEAKDEATIHVADRAWTFVRLRLLTFRLAAIDRGGSVLLGPNIGVRIEEPDAATTAIGVALVLLQVELQYSRTIPGTYLAVMRRGIGTYAPVTGTE